VSQSLNQWVSPSPSPNRWVSPNLNLYMSPTLNQPVSKMSLKLFRVCKPLNPWNLWNHWNLRERMMYFSAMHQSSVQKIPGIIKWRSPIIYATQ